MRAIANDSSRPRRVATALLLAAAVGVAAAPLAFAQTRDDTRATDDAQHAAAAARADDRRNGASLETILADAQRRAPGRVTEVSYDDGEYEIEIRQRDFTSVELTYSARTGELLEMDRD
ncbi:PepSY domain-containing protein [Luteimonas abyssi]|uniref:PepSY domain-containing protein n=1 Tax=Luteimonas abyssi TaxID=1247514 RepID=UPI000737BF48|nr:hypothetical protein [Luteimonas abyssi]